MARTHPDLSPHADPRPGGRARRRVLFVCGRNLQRSPTAARIYATDPRIEARSAGVSESSRHRLEARDLAWADLVLVMEQKHKARIRETFREMALPPIESLEIPDDYAFLDDELVQLLREGTETYLADLLGSERPDPSSPRRNP